MMERNVSVFIMMQIYIITTEKEKGLKEKHTYLFPVCFSNK